MRARVPPAYKLSLSLTAPFSPPPPAPAPKAGDFKAYELKAADVTVASLGELTIYNIRKIFANEGADSLGALRKERDTSVPRRRRPITADMLPPPN